jgi:hypothetical protein
VTEMKFIDTQRWEGHTLQITRIRTRFLRTQNFCPGRILSSPRLAWSICARDQSKTCGASRISDYPPRRKLFSELRHIRAR